MVVTGFDDRIQAFKVINSWGTKWADDGFAWITYRAFGANAHAAYVMDDVQGVTPPIPPPNPPPAPIPRPAQVPQATDVASLARLIEAKTSHFECSRLALKQTSATDVAIRGWVGKQDDLDIVNDLSRTIPSALHLNPEAELRPWPQCEALLTLTDGVKADHGLTLTTIGHPGTDYVAGSKLVMAVKTPDFPSYLYVTYLPANGDAVLLYKPRGVVPQALPARTVVNPPFGPEMVIAVATASPLFTDAIPASATERDYLTALRKTLLYKPDPNQPDRVLDASALALTTHDRAP
jgi:hypothetical protein